MVALQVLGKVPTISVEKTDGCQMFLSEDSKGVEIITAKSSEMNVSIPNGDEFVSNFIVKQIIQCNESTRAILCDLTKIELICIRLGF